MTGLVGGPAGARAPATLKSWGPVAPSTLTDLRLQSIDEKLADDILVYP